MKLPEFKKVVTFTRPPLGMDISEANELARKNLRNRGYNDCLREVMKLNNIPIPPNKEFD